MGRSALPASAEHNRVRNGTATAGDTALAAALHYVITTGIVTAGLLFGGSFLQTMPHSWGIKGHADSLFANWDGEWYSGIAVEGYAYDSSSASSVAFFPGFPFVARVLHALTRMPPSAALLISSHVPLIAVLALMPFYQTSTGGVCKMIKSGHVMAALSLWPMGLFFRMAYSESLFLLLVVLVLLGIARRWPLWVIALIAGAAAGTRSVGVALLLPLAWDWGRRSSVVSRQLPVDGSRPSATLSPRSARSLPDASDPADPAAGERESATLRRQVVRFLARAAAYGPLACWGLLAYMAFVYVEFGDALAFARTQEHWAMRPDLPWPEKLWSLLILEPLWTVYVPSSPAYWAKHEYVDNAVFSLQFWNPIYFLTCAVLVAYGAWKKWLTPPEWLLALGLLGIPYYFQAYRMMMLGFGRFTCVVFPIYLVLGRIMKSLPPPVAVLVYALMAVQLFYWSALFAAWHRVF